MKIGMRTGRTLAAVVALVVVARTAAGADTPTVDNGTIREEVVRESAPAPPAPVAFPAPSAARPAGSSPPSSARPAALAASPAPVPAVPPALPAPPAPRQPAARPPGPGASPAASAASPAPRQAPGNGFVIKFNNADVYEVIHTLGRIAGINYVIDPRVRGVVNIHTQGAVQKDGALELLFSILRINGATAVLEGDVYHIVPSTEAKMEPLSLKAAGEGDPPAGNRPMMLAFALRYIAAAEMAKVIKPFLGAGGDATEVPRANMLLVTDTAANLEKHAHLVELFDADAFRSAGVKLFPLKFLDPEEMAKSLESIFGALDFGARGAKPSGINFVPLARMNALLVVTASPKVMEDVERWVGELDRATTATSRAVRLYRAKHGKAKDLMEILERLYPGKTGATGGKPTEFRPQVAEPAKPSAFPGVRIESKPQAVKTPDGGSAAGAIKAGEKGEEIDIILDEPMNAIILRGGASQLAAILDTLKTIDVYPRQVLLEVLIGEVQLDDALQLGIDWSFQNAKVKDFNASGSLVTNASGIGAGGSQGLVYAMEKTNRIMAAFRALASNGKVSILSAPSVIGTNGKKSRIEVADSVPIVSASIVANSNPPVTTSTVEYKDVGILLNFTPYINDQGTVTLEIEQEVSDISSLKSSGTDNPSFFKRNVQTTLVATENRSLVLGGLVKERKSLDRDGVPFLYKIPIIGWIFGSRSGSTNRTELLIFITPRVIGSVEEGTQLSQEFEERVEELKSRIGEAKGIKTAPAKERQE